MTFDHKIQQVWQYLAKGFLGQLFSANCQNLSPFRLLSVFDPQIIYLSLWYLAFLALIRVYTLIYGILLNLINFLYCFIHLAQIWYNLYYDTIQVFIQYLFHFLLGVVAEC